MSVISSNLEAGTLVTGGDAADGDFALPETGGDQVAWGFFGGSSGGETFNVPGNGARLEGTDGPDTFIVGPGHANFVYGGGGSDTFRLTPGGELTGANGGPGADSFLGQQGGTFGRIEGGPGDDYYANPYGTIDSFDGGSGNDYAVVNASDLFRLDRGQPGYGIDGGSNTPRWLGGGDTLEVRAGPGDPNLRAVQDEDGQARLQYQTGGGWADVPGVTGWEEINISRQ